MSAELKMVKRSASRLRDGNPEPRTGIVYVLDRSGSTEGETNGQMNAALPKNF
jgi:hypothetical protein